MPSRLLPLLDLIETWLHPKPPQMQKESRLSKSLPHLPITWPFVEYGDDSDLSSSRTPVKTLQRRLSGHLARRKHKGGNLCRESKDGQQDEARRMSESARIAFAYRKSQNSVGVAIDSELPSSRSIHLTLGSDDCQENALDVQSAETSKVHHKSCELSNMLSQLSPVIIEKDDEVVLARERCRVALCHHRSIYSNVIVESQCPDKAPHIVISPPPEEDVFKAPYIAQNNQAPFQYHPSLTVPPLCILTCRMMTFEQWHALVYHQFSSFGGSAKQHPRGSRPVFSRPKFAQWVKNTEEHRNCMFRRLIIPAVARHLLRASAVAASDLAPSFRARYDKPGFLESLEKPFRWTDPASALFSLYRGHPVGVHHIPSAEPFTVPHILIEESFGNDQAIVDGNAAPIQNSADRNSLLVPAATNSFPVVDTLSIEELSLDYDSSTYQSSSLDTPIEPGKVDYGIFSSWDTGTLLRDGSFSETQSRLTMEMARPHRDSKALFFIEEEEEDEFI